MQQAWHEGMHGMYYVRYDPDIGSYMSMQLAWICPHGLHPESRRLLYQLVPGCGQLSVTREVAMHQMPLKSDLTSIDPTASLSSYPPSLVAV